VTTKTLQKTRQIQKTCIQTKNLLFMYKKNVICDVNNILIRGTVKKNINNFGFYINIQMVHHRWQIEGIKH